LIIFDEFYLDKVILQERFELLCACQNTSVQGEASIYNASETRLRMERSTYIYFQLCCYLNRNSFLSVGLSYANMTANDKLIAS